MTSTLKNDAVVRAANGLWYIRFQGETGSVAKPTQTEAEALLRRVQAGHARFEPLKDRKDRQSFDNLSAAFSNIRTARRLHFA